ncbi:MAG TPA: hypothetical protein VH396_20905 [Chitinophagaceae bacterium]
MANELAKSFVQSKNKKQAARQIVLQINNLRSSESQKPFDYDNKLAIVKLIYEIIYGLKSCESVQDELIMAELSDKIFFIECVDFIIRRLDTERNKQLRTLSAHKV